MTDENNNRYGTNPNAWRKTYSYVRRKPRLAEVVQRNVNTGVTASSPKTIDLNKIFKHRDYFVIKGDTSGSLLVFPSKIPIIQEGLVYFDNETEVVVPFSTSFAIPRSQSPIVVYSVEPTGDNSTNINVYGTAAPTHTHMFIGVSAPFTGYIRYRAVWSPNGYPIDFPSGSLPYTSSFLQIDAGITNTANALNVTVSLGLSASMPGDSFEFRSTFHDGVGDNSSNVGISFITMSNVEAIEEFSAPTSNHYHYIAYRIVP